MNFNKIGCLLLTAPIVIGAALAVTHQDSVLERVGRSFPAWFGGIGENRNPSERPEHTRETRFDRNVLNQYLQQKYLALANRQAAKMRDGDDADSREMIEESLHSLAYGTNELDRELAVMTLGEYASDKARKGLLQALNDPEPIVREQAVIQISEWADAQERLQMILAALKNERADVVVLALESISEVEAPELIERLKALSRNADSRIREAAGLALELADEQ
ncbi:MAG: HEAT repeat domain-containing protein [Gammaproteobacteria bacterium]